MSRPTRFASAFLSPSSLPLSSLDSAEANATVLLVESSFTWASMYFSDLYIVMRGRAVVPETFLGMRSLRLRRWSVLAMVCLQSERCLRSARLALLATNVLLEKLDALALVRLGRAQRANLNRRLADELAVGRADRQIDG